MAESKMTRAESGRLGGIKGSAVLRERWQAIKEAYALSPSRCLACESILPFAKRKNKFCNQSCSASFNNRGVRRHGKEPCFCRFCGARLDSSSGVFCNGVCRGSFEQKEWVARWIEGKEDGSQGGKTPKPSKRIYRWLVDEHGKKCSICGGEKWRGEPIPLVLDHIDGNAMNNRPENLRLVCRNCDGLLPTFAGRNRGNGKRKYIISYEK